MTEPRRFRGGIILMLLAALLFVMIVAEAIYAWRQGSYGRLSVAYLPYTLPIPIVVGIVGGVLAMNRPSLVSKLLTVLLGLPVLALSLAIGWLIYAEVTFCSRQEDPAGFTQCPEYWERARGLR